MDYREAEKLVKGFESGTYPASDWNHYAHFVMALWYTYHHPVAEARRLIKDGIKKYNEAVGGKNTEDAGYHETITEFYFRVMLHYQLGFSEGSSLDSLLDALQNQPFLQKDFPFKFYSKELLMSRHARATWVAPDLQTLPVAEFVAVK